MTEKLSEMKLQWDIQGHFWFTPGGLNVGPAWMLNRALESEAELARLQALVKKQRAVVEAARPFLPRLHESHNIYELGLRAAFAALDQPAEAGEEQP